MEPIPLVPVRAVLAPLHLARHVLLMRLVLAVLVPLEVLETGQVEVLVLLDLLLVLVLLVLVFVMGLTKEVLLEVLLEVLETVQVEVLLLWRLVVRAIK